MTEKYTETTEYLAYPNDITWFDNHLSEIALRGVSFGEICSEKNMGRIVKGVY